MSEPGRTLLVKLTPRAAQNKIGEWTENEHGKKILKVYVTAVPEDGKANQSLIALLAKSWKIPKSSIKIVNGATDRLKTLRIEKDFTV
jgi:uncharacterized protein